MRIHRVTFGSATVPLSLSRLTIWRGAAASFAARVSLWRSGRQIARFVEIIAFAILLALLALPAPARAQTFTMSSATAVPATVQPGKTVIFTDKITANRNASNYNFAFLLSAPGGSRVAQQYFTITAKAGVPLTEVYGWTVPAGSTPGTYTMETAVFNPGWSQILASKTIALTVTAASAMTYPTLLGAPVISGTAQVGDVLTSTTGTWSGATSFAYQWSGNKTAIAGATAAKYIPVASDAGHTLTSTVTATGSPSALSSATSAATVPIVAASSGSPPPVSGSVPFVALHTYYMSPTGSDNTGLSAATAWASPNHAVNCGDVIIAAAGTYSTGQFGDKFGVVSKCPSTSGGIDGTGGVYFAVLLCAGPDLMSCNITTKGGGDPLTLVELNTTNVGGTFTNAVANYWAIEGFNLNSTPNSRGFGHRTCNSSNGLIHHFAFINNIISNSRQAVGGNDCGANSGSSVEGADYEAIVGNIAQNANQEGTYSGGICVAAFDFTNLGQYNTTAGTHAYAYTNYAMANLVPACEKYYDGEAFMTDLPNVHLFEGTVVYANNIAYDSSRACIQLTGGGSQPVTFKIYNNTCYANNMQPGSTGTNGSLGELNLSSNGAAYPWSISFWNNAVLTPAQTEQGVPLFDEIIGGATWASFLEGAAVGTGDQNVLWDQITTCGATAPPQPRHIRVHTITVIQSRPTRRTIM